MSRYEEDWFAPKTGLLAASADGLGPKPSEIDRDWGVPLPPRRPRDLGVPPGFPRSQNDGADLPSRPMPRSRGGPPSPQEEYLLKQQEIRERAQREGRERFDELKQDYPHGSGYPETAPSFPSGNPTEQPTASMLRQQGQRMGHGLEDIGLWPKQPLPPEFEPARPIPLGEIQRRWGVPRLEDL